MLILTRNKEQKILIKVPPSDVEQQIVLKHCGFNQEGEVRFGIDAARSIEVVRIEHGAEVSKRH